MKLRTMLVMIALVTLSLGANSQIRKYAASAFVSSTNSYGLELTKKVDRARVGIGITTYFNRGSIGKDYSGFFSPDSAVSVARNYSGSIYAVVARKNYGIRLGFGAVKYYHNGANDWYVVTDGGTYLLFGAYKTFDFGNRLAVTVVYDNINELSVGLTVRFNEGK